MTAVDYIIVQAGGRGSRMLELTKNKPKALVPVGNLPMLFHLFRKFPDKTFIIITDYKSDVMKKYLETFASVKYLIAEVHNRKGTCAGLNQAISLVPSGKPFMLIWSDLVLPESFSMPKIESNVVGLSGNFPCRWRYQDGSFEEIPSSETGVAGLFFFVDKEYLKDVPEEGEFVRWLQTRKGHFSTVSITDTKEYGLKTVWDKISSSSLDSRCRPFNTMKIDGDIVIKEGIDEQGRKLAIREVAWYKTVTSLGYNRIPSIKGYNPLMMSRIKGHNIFWYDLSIDEKSRVLSELVGCLRDLHALSSSNTDYESIKEAYLDKTFARIEKVKNLIPFANSKEIVINGKKCRNVFFHKGILETAIQEYKCPSFCLIHGDNTFSNMMLDEHGSPMLIDPRGYFGHTEIYGDPNYDWAKLLYSIQGNYDQFNLKRFDLTIGESDVQLKIESNGWENLTDEYFALLGPEVRRQDIELIHVIIWLSLTTYAWEDYDSICGAFYNGIIYFEEWLKKYENEVI